MAKAKEREITLRVTVVAPPPGVVFAVQRQRSELHQPTRSTGEPISFDLTVRVEPALRPEQLQALEYARRQGTEAPVEAIRAKAARTFGEIEALVAGVPERATGIAPAPGKWSLHEIVDHLVVSHRRAVAELASLVAGEAPNGGPIPAGLVSPEPFARRWPALLADLQAVHRDVLRVLSSANDATPLAARAPVVMVVKCATEGSLAPVEWIEAVDWKAYAILLRVHTLEHLQQAQRTLEAVGEEQAERPRRASAAAAPARRDG